MQSNIIESTSKCMQSNMRSYIYRVYFSYRICMDGGHSYITLA